MIAARLGWCTKKRTSQIVCEYLHILGFEVEDVIQTADICVDVRPGPVHVIDIHHLRTMTEITKKVWPAVSVLHIRKFTLEPHQPPFYFRRT